MKDTYILGIETSCDETSCSIVKNGCDEVNTVVLSQVDIHTLYGDNDDMEEEMKKFLNEKEYKIYDAFKLIINDHSIENFIIYLDQLVDLNSPKVIILVGNKHENYDHLSEYIETKYSDKIYRGLKILYKNKVYDFSLSERNI